MLVRRVGEMERMPTGYAVAWWLEHERRALCLPVGLHAVASWLRARWLALKAWHDASVIERAYMRGYNAGQARVVSAQARAHEEGFQQGRAEAMAEALERERQTAEAVAELRDILGIARLH